MKVYLYLETSRGLLAIPFDSLELADKFTLNYSDRFEFLNNLIQMLRLPISSHDVGRMYFSYKSIDEVEFDYEECMPVRYSSDNYNIDSLIDNYCTYLKRDQNRLNSYGIRNVVKNIFPDFVVGTLSNNQIDLVARTYLRNYYKNMRDVYFLIKDEDGIKIKIDKVIHRKASSNNRPKLYEVESNQDDYLQYLIELSSRGEDGLERAMEELSMMDIEEIRSRLDKTYYGVIDGVSVQSLVSPEEISSLEESTGFRVDVLADMCKKQMRGRKK